MTASERDESTDLYDVVVNEEEQYSIWPVGRSIPPGWRREVRTGTKDECLRYITEVWTDLRPLSLRKRMSENRASQSQDEESNVAPR